MQRDTEDQNPPDRTTMSSGSEIRDHLANERTYLAWLRTAMALLGVGFLAARLRLDGGGPPGAPVDAHPTFPAVGVGFTLLGIVAIILGTWRYLAVRRMIDSESFKPLGLGVIVVSAAAMAVAVGVLYHLLNGLAL